jgi:hypothetical protein
MEEDINANVKLTITSLHSAENVIMGSLISMIFVLNKFKTNTEYVILTKLSFVNAMKGIWELNAELINKYMAQLVYF